MKHHMFKVGIFYIFCQIWQYYWFMEKRRTYSCAYELMHTVTCIDWHWLSLKKVTADDKTCCLVHIKLNVSIFQETPGQFYFNVYHRSICGGVAQICTAARCLLQKYMWLAKAPLCSQSSVCLSAQTMSSFLLPLQDAHMQPQADGKVIGKPLSILQQIQRNVCPAQETNTFTKSDVLTLRFLFLSTNDHNGSSTGSASLCYVGVKLWTSLRVSCFREVYLNLCFLFQSGLFAWMNH